MKIFFTLFNCRCHKILEVTMKHEELLNNPIFQAFLSIHMFESGLLDKSI